MAWSKSMRILILAALPQEYKSFQKKTPPWKLVRRKPLKTFALSSKEKEFFLVETGMGMQPVQEVLTNIANPPSGFTETFGQLPDLLLSVGFAGSLSANFHVGDVLFGQRLVLWEHSYSSKENRYIPSVNNTCFHIEPSNQLLQFCNDYQVPKARIVTVTHPEDKPFLSQHFPHSPSIMDMESHFVAQTAFRNRIPLLCFRAISDGLEDRIDFDPRDITGSDGKVRIDKVLRTVYRQPFLIRSFYSSWQRACKASQNLGQVLSAFVKLPVNTLCKVALEAHLHSVS